MCGICGKYNFASDDHVQQSEVKNMMDRIIHRGPDQEGIYIQNNIGLGHRRLSIIDINNGRQPMVSDDDNYIIVFNGEIYNYLELMRELKSKGHIFKTKSDTEVLLKLYIEYREECLKKLNGMFAFVIYNKAERVIFCARDRIGIKPFYYYHDINRFIFASEIKSILANDINIEVNYEAIQDYLAFQFTLEDKTFYRGIKKLLPGHYIIIKNADMNIKKYWDVNYDIDLNHNEKYYVDELSMLLEDSVSLRLRSDVSIGAHLSGGLDSTTIACIASKILKTDIKTFTGAFSEGELYDETKYARFVTNKIGAQYFEIRPNSNDFIDTFQDIMYFMDEPTAGPGIFPQYFVSKLASANVKVVLGGQGGDEIFGGYIRYIIAYFEQCLKSAINQTYEGDIDEADPYSIIKSLPYLKGYQPLMQKFWSKGLFGNMPQRYYDLIQRMDDIEGIINSEIYDKSYNVFEEFLQTFEAANTKSYFNKMTYFDLKTFLPSLLHVEDRTSMANSIESRVPLLDHRIIELLGSIPPNIKFKSGNPKYLFKKAIRNVIPNEILNRTDKKGFPVPLNKWYQNELKSYVEQVLMDGELIKQGIINKNSLENIICTQQGNYGRQLWGLLSLEGFFTNLKRVL